jgi:hypothetical protein
MTNPYVELAVKCAVCGKVRGEANHYFVVWLGSGMIYVDKYRSNALQTDDAPACGSVCVTTLVSRFLEKL